MLPPLPPREIGSRGSLLPFLADHHLPYLLPAVFYWIISFLFHFIDTRGFLAKYKLHTSAEDLTKNRASRRDVIKFALIQQAAQCTLGYLMADGSEQFTSPPYVIAQWAQGLRVAHLLVLQWTQPMWSQMPWIVRGLKLSQPFHAAPVLQDSLGELLNNTTKGVSHAAATSPTFTAQELLFGKAMYWILVPMFQYVAAMILADTFQYFTHRAFHINKWLYKHVHSMHHDIYVPFAYGAFYNHPLETIPIDGIGFPYCLSIAGLDNRQAAFFGAIWTFKTVVDHCGYDFPYNPCNIVCPNSVLFHDLQGPFAHSVRSHQTWGMKYNFSVYGAFWDWIMGTRWSPHDSKAQEKYRKGKAKAEAVIAKEQSQAPTPVPVSGKSTAISNY
ncbi:MAG: hypothetical protein Q9220_004840 [cf. Caloplaca sp. 1 TL-2023]